MTPLSESETHTRLGELLAHVAPTNTKAIEREFATALQEQPAYPPAIVGMGLLRDLQHQTDQADGYYEQAMALDPGGYLAPYRYAHSRLARLPLNSVDTPREELDRIRALFERALRANHDFGDALFGFGLTYLHEPEYEPGGLDALAKAHRLLPARLDVTAALALLYVKKGDIENAEALLARLRRGQPRPERD